MSVQLRELLEHVLEGEPAVGDEVDAVFREADRLRRRRTRRVLAAGLGAAALVTAAGYLLTTTLLPRSATPAPTGLPAPAPAVSAAPSAAPSAVRSGGTPSPKPSAGGDAVRAVVEPLVKGRSLRLAATERGDGWRRWAVTTPDGRSRGTVKIAVYDRPDGLCFPVRADPDACARADRKAGFAFVRYDDVSDADRQVRQTIARRLSDGRTVTVLAAGERDAGAEKGKPALTGAQVEQVATDERVFAAFGPDERCDGAGSCPEFRVEVPVD